MAIVYLATNRINGKRYVGVTSYSIAKRKREHASAAIRNICQGHFHRSIRKNGIDIFDFIVIDERETLAEAKLAERDWIKELSPEYNSTKGGDGQLGRQVTQRMKDRAKEVHAGNVYRLGKTHTPEVRARLADAARSNSDIFDLYRKMGPQSMARQVVCLDDGKVYSSASKAARAYGVSRSSLIELCLGKNYRKTVGKRKFAYVDKEIA